MSPANDHHAISVAMPGWADTGPVRQVLHALRSAGGEGRFVGGCVRDHLLGRAISDIDLATNLRPEMTIAALKRNGIRAVPTGIAHGTVTAVLDDMALEITTLRRDVETDGRHASVAFTDQWRDDAARRDFTMNALYLDTDGTLHDYHGGLGDLHGGRLRFIGDASARIAEDHLRILRFFRFSAQLRILPPDGDGLAACARAAACLHDLSRERIWQEMQKLLAAPAVRPVLKIMQATGVADHLVGRGGDPVLADADVPGTLADPLPDGTDAIRVLRRLLPDADQARRLGQDWKLSGRDAARLYRLYEFSLPDVDFTTMPRLRKILYRAGVEGFQDLAWLAEAAGRPDMHMIRDALAGWTRPRFPLTGRDVMTLGVAAGPAVGRYLKTAEDHWISSDFAADRAACLRVLENLVARGQGRQRT